MEENSCCDVMLCSLGLICQVAVFLIMGVVKMMNSYFFVVDEFRSKLIKKIDNLQMFYNEEFGDKISIAELQTNFAQKNAV